MRKLELTSALFYNKKLKLQIVKPKREVHKSKMKKIRRDTKIQGFLLEEGNSTNPLEQKKGTMKMTHSSIINTTDKNGWDRNLQSNKWIKQYQKILFKLQELEKQQ